MKSKSSRLKLPDDFLGNVEKFLNTPPPPKKLKREAKTASQKKGRKR